MSIFVATKLTAYSTNGTVKGSKGLVSTSDPAYTSLPADSRKPAGPIDPSSMSISTVLARSKLIA